MAARARINDLTVFNMSTQSAVQIATMIICVGLAVASLSIPLSIHESLENQTMLLAKNRGYDDFLVSLINPLMIQELQAYASTPKEYLLFAPLEFTPSVDNNTREYRNVPFYFTRARIEGIQNLPSVEDVAWIREYFLCAFYPQGMQVPVNLYLVPVNYFQFNTLELSAGKPINKLSPPTDAVITLGLSKVLFGTAEAAVGKPIVPAKTLGRACEKKLTVTGVLSQSEITQVNEWHDIAIFIPDVEPVDVFESGGIPSVSPVGHIWVSPLRQQQSKAIEEVKNFFEHESGDAIFVAITTRKQLLGVFGGISARQAYLPFIGLILALVFFVAFLNLVLIVLSLLSHTRFAIGVKRSLGATTAQIHKDFFYSLIPQGGLAILLGLCLGALVLTLVGDSLQPQTSVGAPFLISPGFWTTFAGAVGGLAFWGISVSLATQFALTKSPVELMYGKQRMFFSENSGRFFNGLGLCISVAVLIILLGLRDGAIAHFDRILGLAGGERAGSFVDWHPGYGEFHEQPAQLTSLDYQKLSQLYPEAKIGWLGRKGDTGAEIIEASANMPDIRPLAFCAGRWFSQDEERQQKYVAVLGAHLASQIVGNKSIQCESLLGEQWHGYEIIGVLNEWNMRQSMGYYADVAYVPIGTSTAEPFYPGGQIPFIVSDDEDINNFVQKATDTLTPYHPEGQLQHILAANKVEDLLTWRNHLYMLLSAFAIVSICIGGLGTTNLLVNWVTNRWREIGIRRAVGAEKKEIIKLILLESLRINFLAAMLGGIGGIGVVILMHIVNDWPLAFYPYWLVVALGVALITSLVFGGIPSLWAATRPPTELLRME